ncbi:hypothetical protein M405DRAFT_858158, partial [Rhizopogon salebrosus TDB-379]
ALALHPPGHSNRSNSLHSLATNVYARFEQRGVLSDLDEAIALDQAALTLRPLGHSNRSDSLSNLAIYLYARFQQRGVLSDLDEVIDLDRAALALCPPGHSNQYLSLNNLANDVYARFQQRGVLSDLNEAIDLHRAALALCLPGHSHRSQSISSLAFILLARFKQHAQSSDLSEAFNLYGQLAQISHAVSHSDLHAAKIWITSAENLNHSSALAAYQTALKFLADWQHVTGLSSSSNHFDVVSQATSSLAMDSFSCGVRYGALETAVVLMEQGRAVFWTQLAHIQTPLHEISAAGDMGKALAAEFNEVSLHLRAMLESSEDKTSQIRQLTMKRDDVISHIRMLPDFSRFLLPPLFSDLQQAAEDGPVIIVNVGQRSCDAMIILSAKDPVHVPLDIARAAVLELSKKFEYLIRDAGSSDNQLYEIEIVSVLRTLWECVVGPIVETLRHFAKPGSRIWWCPTAEFALLPLHAAGPYAKKSRNFPDLYISSYTPTLAALVRARQQIAQDASTPQFVAIGQGNPDEGKALPHVASEVDDVARRVTPILHFTSLMDSDATVQRALDALNTHQWVHLACHGMPNREKPFESSFMMRDGPLTITDIIRPRSHTPEFAFLSACHTTVGYESSPDESIHLAAAMQFSGFRSVIGSMWSVDDEVATQTKEKRSRMSPPSDATVQRALDALNTHQWVHLACHGMPNREKPFESSFMMRDGPLTITDIIRPRSHTPEFAFLSACHTTVGYESSPDESIHLAAAMQFSGFRSVIGSMWSVDDEVVGQIVSAFYDNMVDGSGKLDCRRAAIALHKAIKKLRKKIPLEQQIVLVHIGV